MQNAQKVSRRRTGSLRMESNRKDDTGGVWYSINANDVRSGQQGRRVFHDATKQKKASARLRVVSRVKGDQDVGGAHEDDGFNGRLLGLPGEKQRDGTVVVLIIGITMDELVQGRADRQHRGPLEHRCQKQRNNPGTGGGD
jgi:hypothetical protein